MDMEHTPDLNLYLQKETICDKTVKTQASYFRGLQRNTQVTKTQTSDDEPLIKKDESELPNVT